MTDNPRPTITVLCGSTRFYDQYQQANYDLTMAGHIVLSVGFYPHAAAKHGHGEGVGHDCAQKVALDELHMRKIDLADEVFVLDVDGYIGESTRSEIDYATSLGRPIRYLSDAPISSAMAPLLNAPDWADDADPDEVLRRFRTLPLVHEATEDEGKEMFDRRARALLGVSGDEFLRRWDAGDYTDGPAVHAVASLIPFARATLTSGEPEFTTEMKLLPGYDHRDDNPSGGAESCRLALILRGPLGAIVAEIRTGWMPRPILHHLVPGTPPRRADNPGVDRTLADCYPAGGYVGAHLYAPREHNDRPGIGPCTWIGADTCYGDGSYTEGDTVLEALVTGGSDAAFQRLTELYRTWLKP